MDWFFHLFFQLIAAVLGIVLMAGSILYIFAPKEALDIVKQVAGPTIMVALATVVIAHLLLAGDPHGYVLLLAASAGAYFVRRLRAKRPERPERVDSGERSAVFPRRGEEE